MKVGDSVRVIGHNAEDGFNHHFEIGETGVIKSIDKKDGGIEVKADFWPYEQWLLASELEIVQ